MQADIQTKRWTHEHTNRKADRRMEKQVEGKKGRQTFTCKKTDIKEDMRTERH